MAKSKYKLTFLGTGSAFTVGTDNYQSNMLLEAPNGKKLLIDCGTDARLALYDLGYTYNDIDSVYISHLHADHAGGLEWLALTHYFDPNCGRPRLFIASTNVEPLWKHTLSGGLRTLECKTADLDTFFRVEPVNPSNGFVWEDVKFTIVQMVHVVNGFELMPCFGLIFSLNDTRIMITADTQFSPNQLNKYYQYVDIIFHDCETMPFKSGVHAHYSELSTIPEEYRNKMWLYHYQVNSVPDATQDGFLGMVQKGQVFEF